MTSILIAVELDEKTPAIIQRGKTLAKGLGAKIHLVHVLKPLDYAYPSALTLGYLNMEMEQFITQGVAAAKKSLCEHASTINLESDHCHVPVGHPVSEILKLTKELGCEVIVVGAAGAHLGALLTGSVSNGVLHNSTTDVFVVKS